jgi:hypothetical protein
MVMSGNCRLVLELLRDPNGPLPEAQGILPRDSVEGSAPCYFAFANTTWRTSMLPDRNPASQ